MTNQQTVDKIVEVVLGWEISFGGYRHDGELTGYNNFQPLTDMNHAMMLVESEYTKKISDEYILHFAKWAYRFVLYGKRNKASGGLPPMIEQGYAKTAPEAIVSCFEKIIEGDKNERTKRNKKQKGGNDEKTI